MDLFKFLGRSRQTYGETHGQGDMRDLRALAPASGTSSKALVTPLPTAKKTGLAVVSSMTSLTPNPKTALAITDNAYGSTDLTTLRSLANGTRDLIRRVSKTSPEISGSNYSHARVGIPKNYTAVAYNLDGTFNRDTTKLLAAIIARMDFLGDYTKFGYDDSLSMRSICEMWVQDLRIYGACAAELVLDKARVPYKIQPISYSQVRWYPTADAKGLTPKQNISGNEIDLNISTFFTVALDQDPLQVYPDSPIEPALHSVFFSFEFLNDLRRVIRRVIHPRYHVEIDETKFREWLPNEIRGDQEKIMAFMNQVTSSLGEVIAGLNPEDAIVMFDTMGVTVLDHGNTNLSNEYTATTDIINSKMTTGSKSLPTVLGMGNGTANVASTETLLYVKNVEGSTTFKLNEMLSNILTQAVRLMGQDVYVKFEFESINLRPEDELESFKTQKQSRVLEMLSLNMMSDDEACIILTGHMTPDGYVPLAGTGFRQNTSDPAVANGGSDYNGASNGGSAMNKSLNNQTPTGGGRGSNTKGGTQKP